MKMTKVACDCLGGRKGGGIAEFWRGDQFRWRTFSFTEMAVGHSVTPIQEQAFAWMSKHRQSLTKRCSIAGFSLG